MFVKNIMSVAAIVRNGFETFAEHVLSPMINGASPASGAFVDSATTRTHGFADPTQFTLVTHITAPPAPPGAALRTRS